MQHPLGIALDPFSSSGYVPQWSWDSQDKIPASAFCVGAQNANKATHVCPCGYFNHPEKDCTCPPGQVQKYLNKISGPLLDRIDLHVEVTPVPFTELLTPPDMESSASIRERVIKARTLQQARFEGHPDVHCNAQMSNRLQAAHCELDAACSNLLRNAMEKLRLSARAYDRILRVSRTIADLDGHTHIQMGHIAEAIQYRTLDREQWGR